MTNVTTGHLSFDEIRNLSVKVVEQRKELIRKDMTRPPFQMVDESLQSVVALDPIVKKLFATLAHKPKSIRAPSVVHRFLEETIDFINGSNSRSINIEEWDVVLRMTLEDRERHGKSVQGPNGRVWNPGSSVSASQRILFRPHESLSNANQLDTCLLLHKYLQCKHGLKDVLYTYPLLADIYMRYVD